MKSFKSILCASLLTLAMASATFAGTIYGRTGTIYGAPAPGTIYGLTGTIYGLTIDAGLGLLDATRP
jgi:hypothetical protein